MFLQNKIKIKIKINIILNHYLLLLIISIAATSNGYSQSAKSFYQDGMEAFEEGKYEKAIYRFTKALELNPTFSKALLQRAVSYEHAKKYEEAIKDELLYTELKLSSNEKAEIYLNIADNYINLGKYKEAYEQAQKASVLPKLDFATEMETYKKVAWCSIHTKSYQQAVDLCKKVLVREGNLISVDEITKDTDPEKKTTAGQTDPKTKYYLAIAYDSLKDYYSSLINYKQAVYILRKMKERNNDMYQQYYYSLAYCYMENKNVDSAIANYDIALMMDRQDIYFPKDEQLYYYRSLAYVARNSAMEAMHGFNQTILLNPKNMDAFFQRALLYTKIGQFDNAVNDYNSILSENPDKPGIYKARAKCYMQAGKFKEALKDVNKAIKQNSDDLELKSMMADLEQRDYNANKETDKPVIKLVYPERDFANTVYVSSLHKRVVVEGEIQDASRMASIKANDVEMDFDKTAVNPHFKGKANIVGKETITVSATDIYGNTTSFTYPIYRFEMYSKMMVDISGNLVADKNNTNIKLPNFLISLVDKYGNLLYQKATDENGFFMFENLPHDREYLIQLDTLDPRLKMYQKFTVKDKNNKDILYSFVDKKGECKFVILPTDHNVLSLMSYYDVPVTIDVSGNFKLDNQAGTPLSRFTVLLKDKNGILLGTTTTDGYGMFYFQNLPPDKSYLVTLDANDTKISALSGDIILSDKKGKFIKKISRLDLRSYGYEILPSEPTTLVQMTEMDPWLLALQKPDMMRNMTIFENIYYDFGKYEVTPEAFPILNKAVDLLKKNRKLSLEIYSHTDSQGSDDYNMTLSEKRALNVVEYLQSKGIEKSRLMAKGMGETLLANHCANGIECTEEEHRQNRRTVFKIIH